MKAEYDVEAVITAVAEEGDPADLVFAALSYNYPQLGARLVGDPHPEVDLVVGHVISSKKGRARVYKVRLRLRAAVDEDLDLEQVRAAVLEKLKEALDEATELGVLGVAIDNI